MIKTKSGAAGLSIASNTILIALKLAAGAITGSVGGAVRVSGSANA